MTRRERLERKLERRREWAEKRRGKANAVFASHEPFRHDVAFNTQPGHIPFRARMIAQEDRRSIFSDDANAIQELEIRITNNETKRTHMKEVNRLYRAGDAASLAGLGLNLEALREKLKTAYSWCQQPYPAYELQNLGQRINGDKKRLEQIKAQNARRAEAEATPNGVTVKESSDGYCSVTFAEKPDRSILDALKAAGFFWCKGYWGGKLEQLPEQIKALVAQ
jgi:hypothetical protein